MGLKKYMILFAAIRQYKKSPAKRDFLNIYKVILSLNNAINVAASKGKWRCNIRINMLRIIK